MKHAYFIYPDESVGVVSLTSFTSRSQLSSPTEIRRINEDLSCLTEDFSCERQNCACSRSDAKELKSCILCNTPPGTLSSPSQPA